MVSAVCAIATSNTCTTIVSKETTFTIRKAFINLYYL